MAVQDSSADPGAVVTVRPAVPADAPALSEVAAATFALACPPSTTQEAIDDFIAASLSEAAFARYLADPERTVLVAEHAPGAPFDGYTMLVAGDPVDPDVAAVVRVRPTAELSKIYVREGSHGRGTASELMTRTLDAARDRGAVGIWLGTNQENVRAQRFYVKHGFARVGTKRFKLGDEYEHDFVYERAL
jgi:ribosomal protein S18 acetylase RimI-like enzyme